MEPAHSSSTSQSASSSNQLQALPNDILLKVCLYTMDWNNDKKALKDMMNLCLISKSFWRFVHTRLFESSPVIALGNRIEKDVLQEKLRNYALKAIHDNPDISLNHHGGNALHWAAHQNDVKFLEYALPKIKKFNMSHLVNCTESAYGFPLKPLTAILHTTISDSDKAELAFLCISAGYKEILSTLLTMPLEDFVRCWPQTSAVLAKNVSCQEIQTLTNESFSYQYGSTLRHLLRQYHTCSTCKFA
jgi:hypothetical protein